MKSNEDVHPVAQRIVAELTARGESIAVAESLTGGRLSSTIVSVPGASECFHGGVVAYLSEIKASVLGVSRARLAETGPVDDEVARQMAAHVADMFGADYALSTTGVAGPGPADGHEAGTVWIGFHGPDGTWARQYHFVGDREQVRDTTVRIALQGFHKYLQQ